MANRKFKGVLPEAKALGRKIKSIIFPANGGLSERYKVERECEYYYSHSLGLFLSIRTEQPPLKGIALTIDPMADAEGWVSPTRYVIKDITGLKEEIEKSSDLFDFLTVYAEAVKMISLEDYDILKKTNESPDVFFKRLKNIIRFMCDIESDKIRFSQIYHRLGGKLMTEYRYSEALHLLLNNIKPTVSKCWTCKNCRLDRGYMTPQCVVGHISVPSILTVDEVNKLYPEIHSARSYNPRAGMYRNVAEMSSDYVPMPLSECPNRAFTQR